MTHGSARLLLLVGFAVLLSTACGSPPATPTAVNTLASPAGQETPRPSTPSPSPSPAPTPRPQPAQSPTPAPKPSPGVISLFYWQGEGDPSCPSILALQDPVSAHCDASNQHTLTITLKWNGTLSFVCPAGAHEGTVLYSGDPANNGGDNRGSVRCSPGIDGQFDARNFGCPGPLCGEPQGTIACTVTDSHGVVVSKKTLAIPCGGGCSGGCNSSSGTWPPPPGQ
jgi:hypothetical protein